jgi:hypothetical protein
VQSVALCPGFVDTPMTGFIKVGVDEMIRTEDVAHAVRFLLGLSPARIVPEIVQRAGEGLRGVCASSAAHERCR